jgi:hypothetical protein
MGMYTESGGLEIDPILANSSGAGMMLQIATPVLPATVKSSIRCQILMCESTHYCFELGNSLQLQCCVKCAVDSVSSLHWQLVGRLSRIYTTAITMYATHDAAKGRTCVTVGRRVCVLFAQILTLHLQAR